MRNGAIKAIRLEWKGTPGTHLITLYILITLPQYIFIKYINEAMHNSVMSFPVCRETIIFLIFGINQNNYIKTFLAK